MRKHFAKKPQCKNYWDALQKQESMDAATVDTSHNDGNFDSPSDVWSEDDALNFNDSSSEEDETIAKRDHNDVVAISSASTIVDHQEISWLGFTVDQHCETKLLKILNESCTKRKTQVSCLTKWQALQNCRPIQNTTKLPGKPELDMLITS